jgi:hypothetical protein
LALRQHVRLETLRFVVGLLCVLAVVWVLAGQVPDRLRWTDAAVDANAWRSPFRRLVHTGESYLIPTEFQRAAIDYVPPHSTFAVLPPPSYEEAAAGYGIQPITLIVLPFYLQFLLLPAREVDPRAAQYVVCFACDTEPWDKRTTWLWKDTAGNSIGKVERR